MLMEEYVRRERPPLELLEDEGPIGECSDEEVDEEELNSFLMGDVLAGREPPARRKLSFADKLIRKRLRRARGAKRHGSAPTISHEAKKKKKKKKRKTAAHPSRLTPQLERFMQDAMNMYLNEQFEEAVKLLKEVVRRAPGVHDPFHLLGLIYQEEYGDVITATGYYLLAAHLIQTDLELWKRIGDMSQEIGNIDQAIYCYKKCLKTEDGEVNEEVTFSLAMCHLQKNDYKRAIRRFYMLFELNPSDALILSELSKALMAVGDRETLLDVLLTYYRETGDIATAKHACYLHLGLKLYLECIEFVTSVAQSLGIEVLELPLDILVAHAISSLYVDIDASTTLEVIWESAHVTPEIVYAIGTAWAERCQETALRWFKRGYDENNHATIDALLAEQAIQMAKCVVVIEKNHDMAIRLLKNILQREPSNSQVIILLADILVQAGQHSEADQLLVKLTVTDLNRLKMIQKPIDVEERRAELLYLQSSVQDILDICLKDVKFRPRPCLLAQVGNGVTHPEFKNIEEIAHAWIKRFLRVVNDCELDGERTTQILNSTRTYRSGAEEVPTSDHTDPNKEHNKVPSFLKARKNLGLISVEEIIGWSNYEILLTNAACLMAVTQYCREGVRLLQIITNNRKRYKSSVDIAERSQLLSTVEELSYQLSCFGMISKIALSHAREEMARGGSLKTYGTLICTGSLAKATYVSLSSSPGKVALLENRSWIMRQLLHKPQNYELLMLAGHFCTMTGNWTFAIEEYKRALIQRPNDPLAALCLSTSYFNSLSSRNIKDTKRAILLGMTFLQYSLTLRKNLTESHPCKTIFVAECEYNLARAMHFLNLLHLAVPLYERCIQTIKDAEAAFEGIANDEAVECPCIICCMSRKMSYGYPHSEVGLSGGLYVWKYERIHLLRVRMLPLLTHYEIGSSLQPVHYLYNEQKYPSSDRRSHTPSPVDVTA